MGQDVGAIEQTRGEEEDDEWDETEGDAVEEFAPEDVGAGDGGGEKALENPGVALAEEAGGGGADGEKKKLDRPTADEGSGGGVFHVGADNLLGVDADEAGGGCRRS